MCCNMETYMSEQLIVAICGADMCGKTEIAKELACKTGTPYFKASTEHSDFLKHPERFVQSLRFSDTRMVDMFTQCGYSMILDRCWACEFVYSQALSRPTDMKMLYEVDRAFAKLDTIVVIAQRSNYDNIVDDIDPQRLFGSKLQEIHDLYEKFAEWTACSVLRINVDDENLTREVAEITDYLAGRTTWRNQQITTTDFLMMVGNILNTDLEFGKTLFLMT